MAINGSASYPPVATAPTITLNDSYQYSSSIDGATFNASEWYFGNVANLNLDGSFSTADVSDVSIGYSPAWPVGPQVSGPAVTKIILPASPLAVYDGEDYLFTGCALPSTQVDAIFEFIYACSLISPLTSTVVDTSAGTNAAPTSASLAARTALIAAGNTVTTN